MNITERKNFEPILTTKYLILLQGYQLVIRKKEESVKYPVSSL